MASTFLIADDSQLTRTLIKNTLVPEGLQLVGEASDGAEAVQLAQLLQPDLATVDMNMPGLTGAETIRAILGCAPRCRILLITARHEGMEEMTRAGAGDILHKPFTAEALTGVVRRLLGIIHPAGVTLFKGELPPPDVLGDFKEIGNIGAGNAAASLADVIHRRCVISLPDIFPVTGQNLMSKMGAEASIVTALLVKVSGELPATILVMLKRQHAHTVVRYATNSAIDGTGKEFSFTAQFALRQLADALTASFTAGVNELLSVKTKRGAGQFMLDLDADLVKKILVEIPVAAEAALAISCDFYDAEKSFEGKFMYFIEEAAQKTARQRIERLLHG